MKTLDDLSLLPDDYMKWIYDYLHPNYHSDYARDLRARRDAAMRSAPQYLFEIALQNDNRRREEDAKQRKLIGML